MKQILCLASSSLSRQKLLKTAQIPFRVIQQHADESACDWGLPFQELLKRIALSKMEHAIMPGDVSSFVCYVLTADTMIQNSTGRICGKPKDYDDAYNMILSLEPHGRVGTAFCLERRTIKNGVWGCDKQVLQYVETGYEIVVQDKKMIEMYLKSEPHFTSIGGALRFEGCGAQLITSINGSFTSIQGLPLAEVRLALLQLGFFE